MRILGIDPGSRITGFGLVEKRKQQLLYIACGCIRLQGDTLPVRLQEIFKGISQIITDYQPEVAAIEQAFMYRNASSALKLGEARGAALVACTQYHLPVYEYAATYIKQTVVGKGHAHKEQVQYMVKMLLALSKEPQTDAADALAIALCHARTMQMKSWYSR